MPDKGALRRIVYATLTLIAAACICFTAWLPTTPYKLANQ